MPARLPAVDSRRELCSGRPALPRCYVPHPWAQSETATLDRGEVDLGSGRLLVDTEVDLLDCRRPTRAPVCANGGNL